MKIKNIEGEELRLTATRIIQGITKGTRFIKLADLKKYLPKKDGQSTADRINNGYARRVPFPTILHYKYDGYPVEATAVWLETSPQGELSIGCQHFDLA